MQQALERAHGLSSNLCRAGRRSVVLGGLLVAASTMTVLATANTPPTITSMRVSPTSINEGQTVTLTGMFTDPDAADLDSVRIKWRDGSPTQQIPAGRADYLPGDPHLHRQLHWLLRG